MNQNEINNDFESISVLALLLRHKWYIIGLTALATIGVTIYAFMKPNEYVAVVNAVPPKNSDSFDGAMASFSSTLRDLGVSKLSGGAKDSYDFIVILNSRSILDSMIYHFDLINRYKDKLVKPTIDYAREELNNNLDISYEREGNYIISCWDTNPQFATEMANKFLDYANLIALKMFKKESEVNLGFAQERYDAINNKLQEISDSLVVFSSKNKVFSPTDQAKAVTTALSDMKAQTLQYEMLYDFSKKLYGADDYRTEYLNQLQSQSKSSLDTVLNKPGFAGNFSINQAADVGIKYLNLYADMETYTKLKAYTLPMLEKARLDQTKNFQNLIAIDPAVVPTKKDRPKRSIIVLGTFVGAFALSIMLVLIWSNIRAVKARLSEIKNEKKSD